MSSKVLVENVKDVRLDNREEFGKLVEKHQDGIMRFALGLTQNHNDAEDLYQEALLRAYRFFHRFEKGTNFMAWVTTVMRNVYISLYRRAKRSPVSVEMDTLELMSHNSPTANRKEAAMSGEKLALDESIRVALSRVPEKFRRVIILADVLEMKYREVARILHVPIGTVMSRLFRARRVLRDRLLEVAA